MGKIKPNEKCHCSSGKKYKKCCGKQEENLIEEHKEKLEKIIEKYNFLRGCL